MAFQTTTQVTRTVLVELRNIPYRDWPSEARGPAKVVLSRPGLDRLLFEQIDRKDWLVSQVEAMQANNRTIAEWLGEA
jgi:hypothetical protein